jgi:FtsZ-binding cell division protein ZapB
MKSFTEREVLLQVKRVYSKDEVIAELHRQIKDYGFQVGILESEIAELKDENASLKKNGVRNRQDEYVLALKTTIEGISRNKNKYKKLSEELMRKNAVLSIRLDKILNK